LASEVLRKKLLAGAEAVPEGGPGIDRAWRVAFARATRDMMKLPVDFVGLKQARMSLAEILDLPGERSLIFMLEGPEDGLGLLILSPELLTAMIEVLTMGRVAHQPGEPRKPTRTDAAMLAPLADLALRNLEEALAEEADLVWTSGFHYGSFIEEARALGLLLEDIAYRAVTARLSVAGGARVGEMQLVLPAEGRGRKPKVLARGATSQVAGPAFTAALTARVEAADCQLQAVLGKLSLSLAQTTQLEVDMILPLPSASLNQVSILGLNGREVGVGKLGQHRGMRAVRLIDAGQLAPAPKNPLASSSSPVAQDTAQEWGGAQGLGAFTGGSGGATQDHGQPSFPRADGPATSEGGGDFPAMDFNFDPLPATGTD
jgi:flagellar motor switch protein FliM